MTSNRKVNVVVRPEIGLMGGVGLEVSADSTEMVLDAPGRVRVKDMPDTLSPWGPPSLVLMNSAEIESFTSTLILVFLTRNL